MEAGAKINLVLETLHGRLLDDHLRGEVAIASSEPQTSDAVIGELKNIFNTLFHQSLSLFGENTKAADASFEWIKNVVIDIAKDKSFFDEEARQQLDRFHKEISVFYKKHASTIVSEKRIFIGPEEAPSALEDLFVETVDPAKKFVRDFGSWGTTVIIYLVVYYVVNYVLFMYAGVECETTRERRFWAEQTQTAAGLLTWLPRWGPAWSASLNGVLAFWSPPDQCTGWQRAASSMYSFSTYNMWAALTGMFILKSLFLWSVKKLSRKIWPPPPPRRGRSPRRNLQSSFCNVCQKPSQSFCATCKQVAYCGPICQKVDWMSHQQNCNAD